MQVINAPNRSVMMGQAMGQGLSSGLKGLIDTKVKQLEERQYKAKAKTALSPLIGEQSASMLSALPKEMFPAMFKALLSGKGPEGEANPVIQRLMQGIQQQEQAPGQMMSEGAPGSQMVNQMQELGTSAPESMQEQSGKIQQDKAQIQQKEVAAPQTAISWSKKIKSMAASNKEITPQMMKQLKKKGFDAKEISAITSTTLTPDVVDFFLSKTKQNPQKARALAKKYGFKVQ